MPHIHTQPGQHDHTVTAYVIRTDTAEPKALLHMHKKLSKLLAIGGHIELDETPWQAVAHELEEESGYKLSDLTILQPKERIKHLDSATLHPYPLALNTHRISDDHLHSDIQYGFISQSDPSLDISDGESLDLRWYTFKELQALDDTQTSPSTRQIYSFMFETALPTWQQVPTDTFTL